MKQQKIYEQASVIAYNWIKHEPLEIQTGLRNEKGLGTILGLQVHGILQTISPETAQSYYKKVLKFSS